jgi:hypothetical protein
LGVRSRTKFSIRNGICLTRMGGRLITGLSFLDPANQSLDTLVLIKMQFQILCGCAWRDAFVGNQVT